MKTYIKILMLICFATFSQAQNNFNSQWTEVKKLENKGLTKSAAELVDTIYNKALKEENQQQRIKALLHKSKYMLTLEEEAQLKIVNLFKSEIEKSKNVVSQRLLENMLATMYWQYFQQNRYKFYNRSKTSDKVSDDFRTWDLQTLFNEIHFYYQRSLLNNSLLQKENLNNYSVLINTVENSKTYRPTLYDLLSHNALDFYETDENSITKPVYQFKIDNENYISESEEFIALELSAKDSLSLQLNALKIYQDLLKFHKENKVSKAFVAVDIDRLNFVARHATFSNVNEQHLKTLRRTSDALGSSALSGLYDFEIASVYQEQGNSFDRFSNENNETHRWKLKEAVELCSKVISDFPQSDAAKKCDVLKQQISQPNIRLQAEQFISVDKPSRLLVTYKNLKTLDFDIYEISKSQLNQYNSFYRADEKASFFNSKSPIKTFTSNLKTEGDYQEHSTEIVIPKLKNGLYLIKSSTQKGNNVFAVSHIQVADLALIESRLNDVVSYQLINRNNGKPIVDAEINITFTTNRNNKSTETKSTNRFGKFEVEKSSATYSNLDIKAVFNNEIGYFGNYYIGRIYEQNQEKKTQYKNFLFTDRSIYRPGQTVYFKGIATFKEGEKTNVNSNEAAKIRLKNVNGEVVSELRLKTNEFGSVHGEFILPNDGLTGNYTIDMFCGNYGYTNFSVEEYKRPKFKPEFKPITETFKVNDSITVKGKAVAFAGSNITDAKVVYRVKRQVRYPSWYYWRRPYFNSEPQEIAFGETQTDAKGEFDIMFKAHPDESVSKESLPIFNYEVIADVTDINGETRSVTTIVNVGYHAMTLNIVASQQIDKTKKESKITIESKNLNGEFVPTKGILKIYKLQAPNNVLRPRPWNAPDYQTLSKTEFKTLFPHDSYNNEDELNNWKKGEAVFSTNFDTELEKTISLKNLKKWKSGAYIIVTESEDKFGQNVKAEAYTALFSDNDKSVSDNQLFKLQLDKDNYKTNSMAKLTVGSAVKNVIVTLEMEKNQKIILTQLVTLNNSKETIIIPISENDLGGFIVHTSFAAFNYYHTQSTRINVPYPKTDLEIETTTFRDKLQPGQDESWSFKIKGPKGDKVSAELLASMYDASLDEFKSHNWSFKPINRPSYYARINRNSTQSFNTTNFRLYNGFGSIPSYPYQNYDSLNWFGLSFDGSHYYLRQNYLRKKYANIPSYFKSEKKSDIEKGVIEGIVIAEEDGLPLPGATIIINGTSNGTQTNFDGAFKIEAKRSDKLSVSYVGLKTLNFTVSDDNFYTINLTPDHTLDEVVVVGYGTTTKQTLTGSAHVIESKEYESLDKSVIQTTGEPGNQSNLRIRGNSSITGNKDSLYIVDGEIFTGDLSSIDKNSIISTKILKDSEALALYGEKGKNGVIVITTNNSQNELQQVKVRKNLNETAFFFPNLKTDEGGNVSFNFTAPEALTKWKLQLLAHTKTLESAVTQLETVTQKELMIIPNAPRFLRVGDTITISTKIANLTDKALTGVARLQLTDAMSGESIDSKLSNDNNTSNFTVDANGNTQISWNLNIPKNIQAVQYRVIAKAGDFSDGEQNALPVLSNRMLVTETLPMWIRSNETKTFTLNKLKNNTSTSLSNHKLTLEMTSNPAWYAVQALPYLMEYPYDCNEQTFARYYSNALAQHIVKSNPRIEAVFNQWKSTDALLSNLEKNEELKSILIEETPWLRDAQSEAEQKKRIGLLFDLNKMNNELKSAMLKLKNNQYDSGAWPWFNGGRDNRYITQHIIAGFGHLKKLNVIQSDSEESMIKKAIQYLDSEFIKEYNDLKKYNKDVDLSKDHLSYTQLHYLYVRSFYPELKPSNEVEKIMTYYQSQIKKYWLKRSLYAKGLMALTMKRMNNSETANEILKSLKENSITSEELGMYWKANSNSWLWYQAPIETQALMIEAFAEVGNGIQSEAKNLEDIDNLKIWLLKNKQTNSWKTTKATTEAVYALLLQGSDWLSVTEMVDVQVGDETISPSTLEDVKLEAGTGYYKTSWTDSEIQPEMADVTITKKGDGIAWGTMYWQYFEDLDKITSAETPLKLSKTLFLKSNTDKGEEISEITSETKLKIGDLVRVRIELRTDRSMEFIHLKDMRAAGFEPVNVLSQYKRQDGLGYYESTKDAATNFFIDYLPKGVYIFEYDLRVNNAGDMSNGVSTIQSMYAPEFSSHSDGIRINVVD